MRCRLTPRVADAAASGGVIATIEEEASRVVAGVAVDDVMVVLVTQGDVWVEEAGEAVAAVMEFGVARNSCCCCCCCSGSATGAAAIGALSSPSRRHAT